TLRDLPPVFADELRHVVEDQAAADFLHGDPLRLVRGRTLRIVRLVVVAQADQRSAAKLLRTHRGDVDVEKPAFDGGRFRTRRGSFLFGRRLDDVVGFGHMTSDRLAHGTGDKGEGTGLSPPRPSPDSGRRQAATSTLIVRGFASSRNGSFTASTPFLYSA